MRRAAVAPALLCRTPGGHLFKAGCLGVLLVALVPSAAHAQSTDEMLTRATNAFQFRDFGQVIDVLAHAHVEGLPSQDQRIEAYKMLGLSYFYSKKPTLDEATAKARVAFFELLKENPDYELDSFLVPPDAIAFFNEVKREPAIARIRKFRHDRMESERQEREARDRASLSADVPHKVVNLAVSSPVLALLPFGIGQFQNGNAPLGIALAVTESAGASMSLLSFIMVEVLRDPASNQYKQSNVALATNFRYAMWVGAGIFYGLWVAGLAEAFAHYVPSRPLPDGPPSAAPAGPLKPPPAHAALAPDADPAAFSAPPPNRTATAVTDSALSR